MPVVLHQTLFSSIPFLQKGGELMGNIIARKVSFFFLIPLSKHDKSSKASSMYAVGKFRHLLPTFPPYINTFGKLKTQNNNPQLDQKK